jgi:hypothetical protein
MKHNAERLGHALAKQSFRASSCGFRSMQIEDGGSDVCLVFFFYTATDPRDDTIGILTVNVEPCPGVLCTEIFPPKLPCTMS